MKPPTLPVAATSSRVIYGCRTRRHTSHHKHLVKSDGRERRWEGEVSCVWIAKTLLAAPLCGPPVSMQSWKLHTTFVQTRGTRARCNNYAVSLRVVLVVVVVSDVPLLRLLRCVYENENAGVVR